MNNYSSNICQFILLTWLSRTIDMNQLLLLRFLSLSFLFSPVEFHQTLFDIRDHWKHRKKPQKRNILNVSGCSVFQFRCMLYFNPSKSGIQILFPLPPYSSKRVDNPKLKQRPWQSRVEAPRRQISRVRWYQLQYHNRHPGHLLWIWISL